MKLATFTLLAVLAAPAAHAVEYTTVLPKQSSVQFEFRQMGVPVKGGFKRFTTQMQFDPARPEAARASIEIDLGSIDAGSPEADDESAGKLWFNRSVYPKATFVSKEVRAFGNNRFELRGTLTLKGKPRDMVIPVSYAPGKNASTFDGSFVLKRLDFGIGEGMWADVGTVANEVQVRFRIAATGK
ncbi:MAG TPA: YceI family protein [Thiobacillus sp.]|nr:MAG: polyisoprenoid-binding protein [Hydrogenophilales bacterium 16-64-40]OZA33032.1 MAG: polyisoprenoid-binding protein [Hydrogenophilales bacterium 17-64-65]HQS82537.1 YceI family protein [Thiobacillus sp.]HQT34307.1 YceI family protein [Thiobacillus sp.]